MPWGAPLLRLTGFSAVYPIVPEGLLLTFGLVRGAPGIFCEDALLRFADLAMITD